MGEATLWGCGKRLLDACEMDLLTRLSAFITVMTICGADRHGRRGRHSPLLRLCGHLFIYFLGRARRRSGGGVRSRTAPHARCTTAASRRSNSRSASAASACESPCIPCWIGDQPIILVYPCRCRHRRTRKMK
eukprot:3928387-Pyramimonas_sp.AAC.1